MAITAEHIAISDEAVALNTAGNAGQYLVIQNAGEAAVDLGDATVAATEGFPLGAGETVNLALGPGEVVYAIRTTGADSTLAVLRT